MKKLLILLILIQMPVLTMAQASGGQIRRNKTTSKSVVKQTPQRNTNKGLNSKNKQNTKLEQDYNCSQSEIQPTPLSSLATYNVVAQSTGKLDDARSQCWSFRNRGYSSIIYKDPNMGKYLIIAISTNDEQEALSIKNNIKKAYNKAWILYIVNGLQEIYKK